MEEPLPGLIRSWLYIGNVAAAHNEPGLKRIGITHVLNVADDVHSEYDSSIQYRHMPVKDWGADQEGIQRVFGPAKQFLDGMLQGQPLDQCQGKLMVNCRHAMNRSVTVCIALLMQAEGCTLKEAYKAVFKATDVCLEMDNRQHLVEFEQKLRGESSASVMDLGYSWY
eukprot:TRINITY_DN7753_c0_g1_i3.p1 TRINITY_DN7753_c0_g1~~TRINITY_DN7753_c0_g1_i3.p1  ORF type:complete len:168 (+),score=37.88 TRINITY_DN7753_c0_g1_i3:352-855(+)